LEKKEDAKKVPNAKPRISASVVCNEFISPFKKERKGLKK